VETEHPSAAESVREGLDETLTVLTLNLSARLPCSLATTNAAESLLSRTRHVKRNVKRWRSGQMMLRWVAAGVLEAVKGFRRVKGYADMPTLVAALRARDRQLGLVCCCTKNATLKMAAKIEIASVPRSSATFHRAAPTTRPTSGPAHQ
jgi:hypothetical protein